MHLQTPRIIWIALLNSTVIYTVVGFLIEPVDSVLDPRWLVTLIVLSSAAAVASVLVGKRFLERAYRSASFEIEEVPDANAESMFRDAPPMIRRFAHPERVRKRLGVLFMTPFILELALSELVAVCGILAAILGAEPGTWLPFIGAGAVLIAVRFPTEARFVRALERTYDARMP